MDKLLKMINKNGSTEVFISEHKKVNSYGGNCNCGGGGGTTNNCTHCNCTHC